MDDLFVHKKRQTITAQRFSYPYTFIYYIELPYG